MRLFIFTVLLFAISAIYASPVAITRRQDASALSVKRSSLAMPSPTLVNRAGHCDHPGPVHLGPEDPELKDIPRIHNLNSIKALLPGASKIAGGYLDTVYRLQEKYKEKAVIVIKLFPEENKVCNLVRNRLLYFKRVYGWVEWGTEDNVYYVVIEDHSYISRYQVLLTHPHANLKAARVDTIQKHQLDVDPEQDDFLYKFDPLLSCYKAIWI